ncbi:asparagine synthase-related protein [Alteriqipengyuania flavescens]|uniref:asparagine synthase-related protein n=1 Tax=Alteriqipengyuania flavescens TaxID=3053610 RepID=UPI0025B449E8|nr:asparagine synthetase B family protein [Alteriqipengyuania flavescens]WJY19695.1 asparagine synthase-related protein [Alteriqipengyuania flavescens]WJY25635.1 asparagine synthase-related protein [Alteriqipengyuania flavescens]
MIALGHHWSAASWLDTSRIAPSLGLFTGHPASSAHTPAGLAASLPHPRAAPDRSWTPATGPDGSLCLFCGWIDNHQDLAESIDVADRDDAHVFAHLVAQHGDFADRPVIGSYAAIVIKPDGTLRLSRSAWDAPSLFWAGDDHAAVVASVPRVLFAAGFPRRLHRHRYANMLFGIEHTGTEFWYDGVHRVPQGSIVTLGPDGFKVDRWYDPHALPPTKLPDDADYLAAADALLDEAVAAALDGAEKPGLLLSGGLDSGIAAEAVLRQLWESERLPSFTVVPEAGTARDRRPGIVTDERAAVEAFATMHRRIDANFVGTAEFDNLAERFFTATSTGRPGQAAASFYHNAYSAAARAGCDVLLTGFMGNDTLSNDAPWAPVEFLVNGKWRQLSGLLAHPAPGDERSRLRRFAAQSLLPIMPEGFRRFVRKRVHGEPDFMPANGSLVRPDAIDKLDLRERARRNHCLRTGERPATRRQWLDMVWHGADAGAEMHHGFEQVFGIRQRDIYAYRPLIEFCITLPTSQFVRGGVTRYLARRLAKGRLPEAQRTERRLGMHNADRHARLTPRREELRESLRRMEAHPELGAVIDFDRAYSILDNWPARSPAGHAEAQALLLALPGVVLAGRFADHLEGRN